MLIPSKAKAKYEEFYMFRHPINETVPDSSLFNKPPKFKGQVNK